MKITQRFIAGIRVNTTHRVPEGRMNIGVSSTIFPSHEWLGYFHMLLTEQLRNICYQTKNFIPKSRLSVCKLIEL